MSFSCSYAVTIWRATGIPITYLCNPEINIEDKLCYIFTIDKDTTVSLHSRYIPLWIMWRLWKTRNDLVFNRISIDLGESF